mgnify:FL=1
MHDGKNDLLKFIEIIHPNQEFSPIDLEPGGAHALPAGFTITANPFGVSTQVDPNRLTLFGPLDTAVAIPTMDMFGGRVVIRGIALLQAIARLVEVGPPVWSRRPIELSEWWKTQIAGCEPFTAPELAPKTRKEMESHIDRCELCQPVSQAMADSISAGSTAYRDSDIADMIERSHADQSAAIAHYEQKRGAHCMVPTNAEPSPAKRRRTAVEVPA